MFFQTNLVPMLLGHTGIGKTELVQQLAESMGVDLIILHVAQLEPSDFVGLYKINEDGRTSNCPPNWLPYKTGERKTLDFDKTKTGKNLVSFLAHGMDGYINPKGGIIFLDEINRGHEDIRQALYQLLTTKKIHTYALPENYKIVAAANPSEHYETYDFDRALVNRFAWIKFEPDFSETINYLEGKHGRNPITSWLYTNKDLLDLGNDDFEVSDMALSPRITENAIKLYEAVKGEKQEFQRKLFETIIQKEKVQSFLMYLEEIKHITFKDILEGKKKEKVKELLDKKRIDIISTLVLDLGDIFKKYELNEDVTEYIPAGKETERIKNLSDFLKAVLENGKFDDLVTAFLDILKRDGFNAKNKKSLYGDAYFRKSLTKLAQYGKLFEGVKN